MLFIPEASKEKKEKLSLTLCDKSGKVGAIAISLVQLNLPYGQISDKGIDELFLMNRYFTIWYLFNIIMLV